ncbi:MAG: PD40 domain-containing protein [Candidatus Krumholzibacteriota bacterium]|nr:PD40 domain-containing protein [Candidatus Krumholzibacteriota bacterium]
MSRIRRGIAVLAVCLGPGAAGTPAVADTTQPPDTTKMSRLELMAWRARQQGTQPEAPPALQPLPAGVTRLTETEGLEKQPSWSPDGRSLTFVYEQGAISTIRRLDLDTGWAISLTDSAYRDSDPDISPDGDYMVWSSRRTIGTKLWVMRLEDGMAAKLTPSMNSDRELSPCWSGNGRRIYYTQNQIGGAVSLPMAVSREGENAHALLEEEGQHLRPAVSPDGGRIAWLYRLGRGTTIRLMDAAVTALYEEIPLAGYQVNGFAWLPDGRRMIVSYLHESRFQAGFDLGILDLGTGEIRLLLDIGKSEMDPALSPDGTRLAFVANREGANELYVYELP